MQKEKETISLYGEGRSLVHIESKQENTIGGFVELLALVSWVLKALTQLKTKSQMNRTQPRWQKKEPQQHVEPKKTDWLHI